MSKRKSPNATPKACMALGAPEVERTVSGLATAYGDKGRKTSADKPGCQVHGNSPARILIVAPNASSRFGGEAFLPLKYFQLLRQRGHPARLIAHARNRADLEEMLAPFHHDIFYIEDSLLHRMIWKVGFFLPGRLRDVLVGTLLNIVNERFQARLIRRLVAAGEVDVIHQPIPVSPLAPSSLYGFGVPVVIGPMNGGMTFPAGYEDLESPATRRFVQTARGLARLLNRLIPGKQRAAALLVANDRTRRALPFQAHPNIIALVENGVDPSAWPTPANRTRAADAPFRLVFMGRLVGWKAVEITLDALARARAAGTDATLDILGDGPERAGLEAQVARLGLTQAVRFHGFLPQAACAPILAAADALILNSVWECGGAVVLEAMGMGLPVIGPDWGGPADYLDETCGILVAPTPRATYADRLAEGITRLARDPTLRARMGAAGAARVRAEFDWEKKVDRMMEVYNDVRKAKG
jgi:glycosyltransferase involved in cell wall biosynthesis